MPPLLPPPPRGAATGPAPRAGPLCHKCNQTGHRWAHCPQTQALLLADPTAYGQLAAKHAARPGGGAAGGGGAVHPMQRLPLSALVRALGLIHARLQGLVVAERKWLPWAATARLANTRHTRTHATPATHRKAVPKHDKDARACSCKLHAWKLCTHKAHRSRAKLCVCERCRCTAHTSQEASQHSTTKVQASQPAYHTERRTADCTLQSLNATPGGLTKSSPTLGGRERARGDRMITNEQHTRAHCRTRIECVGAQTVGKGKRSAAGTSLSGNHTQVEAGPVPALCSAAPAPASAPAPEAAMGC
jgi:hypothetical protein